MKGVSAVIATILLLLIVIAIVGFASGFFQRIMGTTTAAGEQQIGQQTEQLQKTARVDNAAGTAVVVRNSGSVSLTAASDVTVYVNNVLTTCSSWSSATIAPGTTATCTLPSSCSGLNVRITTAGGSDSVACA